MTCSPDSFERRQQNAAQVIGRHFPYPDGSGPFFFHRDGDCAGSRQAHLVTLDAGDQAPVDIVMMALVRALATVLLGELNAVRSRHRVPEFN
jgi:hypothetical protein